MVPRWYRSRWFWLGLLGLVLLIGGWITSFAGSSGHTWMWSSARQRYFVSHGAGWIGAGTGESMAVRYPSYPGSRGWRFSAWNIHSRDRVPWLPPVQLKIERGNIVIWIHYSFCLTAWSIAWLVPLACRSLPRRTRPPRFPGTPRPWYASPFLWAGLPGFAILLGLWIDSSGYRSYASWRWSRAPDTKPDYLGFGIESNHGQIATWAGRPSEGFLSNSQATGFLGLRQKSYGIITLPGSGSSKGKARFKTSYLAVTGLYLILWSSLAATWQYRQPRPRPMR